MKIQRAWVPPIVLVVAVACKDTPQRDLTGINPSLSSSSAVRTVVGQGSVPGSTISITAVLHEDGRVEGRVLDPRSTIKGPVVGLVPPHDAIDFYCINMTIANAPEFEGLNLLFYVRDIGDGKTTFDELSGSGGFGVTCADIPVPAEPFQLLIKGDYKTF